MELSEVLTIRVGKRARAHIIAHGLCARDIDAVPAAAGGPKGLGLIGLDTFLFGEWFRDTSPTHAPRRILAGASIGAWRMTAAACADPVRALERLANAYVEQIYPPRPPPALVTAGCRDVVRTMVGAFALDPRNDLMVVTARSHGVLERRYSQVRFGAAVLANLASRAHLAGYFSRIVFRPPQQSSASAWSSERFDAFGWQEVVLDQANAVDALAASGAIPLVINPGRDIAGAPKGLYWDGGLIDYHLSWPWQRLGGLVLYPHFVDHIVPGWLDKSMRWRRARGEQVENVILIAPSPKFLASLPMKKLPDRKDFYRFGHDNVTRIATWRKTMSDCQRMADAFAAFCDRPNPALLRPMA